MVDECLHEIDYDTCMFSLFMFKGNKPIVSSD